MIYYLAGRGPSRGASREYPQALLIPLTLSKRAHSIYLLRLFNDPLATVLLYLSVVAMMIGGKRAWRGGCILFRCVTEHLLWGLRAHADRASLALGIKMNILLLLPGLLVLLFQYRGLLGTLEGLGIITMIQVSSRPH